MVGGAKLMPGLMFRSFNFGGADQEKKCGVLSGGERNSLHLALP
jgi:energy-dependent translational throttle protein EttA